MGSVLLPVRWGKQKGQRKDENENNKGKCNTGTNLHTTRNIQMRPLHCRFLTVLRFNTFRKGLQEQSSGAASSVPASSLDIGEIYG